MFCIINSVLLANLFSSLFSYTQFLFTQSFFLYNCFFLVLVIFFTFSKHCSYFPLPSRCCCSRCYLFKKRVKSFLLYQCTNAKRCCAYEGHIAFINQLSMAINLLRHDAWNFSRKVEFETPVQLVGKPSKLGVNRKGPQSRNFFSLNKLISQQ